jgi:hypothetical protein
VSETPKYPDPEDEERSGWGCLTVIVVMIIVWLAAYYWAMKPLYMYGRSRGLF